MSAAPHSPPAILLRSSVIEIIPLRSAASAELLTCLLLLLGRPLTTSHRKSVSAALAFRFQNDSNIDSPRTGGCEPGGAGPQADIEPTSPSPLATPTLTETPLLIRHADPDRDAAACAAIYAPSVTAGVASLEERAPEPREMAERIRIISRAFPWLVAELPAGGVIGYAYASRHRDRASYRWSADVTVYISAEHHRRGAGRRLYTALFDLLARQGLYQACAGITLPNDASVGLHESLGFVPVGVYRDIAYKFGSWRSVGWWQKTLRERSGDPAPGEIGPPQRLG